MTLKALGPRITAGMVLGLLLGAGLGWPGLGGGRKRQPWATRSRAPGSRPCARPIILGCSRCWAHRRDGACSADVVQGGGNAARAVATFAVLLLASAVLGAIAAIAALRVWPIAVAGGRRPAPHGGPSRPAPGHALSGWILNLMVNPIKAAADGAMAPVVVFALLFGLAATVQTAERRAALFGFFEALQETMLTLVGWVLTIAPVGVFFLALSIGARAGMGIAATLGQYVILVSVICLIGALPAFLLGLFGGAGPARVLAGLLPSQLMALSTQSSLASLPVMLRGAEGLGVPERIRGLVLPMSVALFRATNPAANMAIVLYVAGVYGIELPLPRLLECVGLAALMSLAGVGVASSVAFATVMIPMCIAMNLPIAILPLLLSVEPILDFSRTLGNVTADLAVTVANGDDGRAAARLKADPRVHEKKRRVHGPTRKTRKREGLRRRRFRGASPAPTRSHRIQVHASQQNARPCFPCGSVVPSSFRFQQDVPIFGVRTAFAGDRRAEAFGEHRRQRLRLRRREPQPQQVPASLGSGQSSNAVRSWNRTWLFTSWMSPGWKSISMWKVGSLAQASRRSSAARWFALDGATPSKRRADSMY